MVARPKQLFIHRIQTGSIMLVSYQRETHRYVMFMIAMQVSENRGEETQLTSLQLGLCLCDIEFGIAF